MKKANQIHLEPIMNTDSFIMVFSNPQELRYLEYNSPHEYFNYFWSIFLKYKNNNSLISQNKLSGQIFIAIIAFLLDREGIKINSINEKLIGIYDVRPNISLMTNKGKKIFLFLKNSLRERWKLADWDSIYIKKQFPDSRCIIITNNERETNSLKKKISHISLDDVFYVVSSEFDELIFDLKTNIK